MPRQNPLDRSEDGGFVLAHGPAEIVGRDLEYATAGDRAPCDGEPDRNGSGVAQVGGVEADPAASATRNGVEIRWGDADGHGLSPAVPLEQQAWIGASKPWTGAAAGTRSCTTAEGG